MSDKKPEQTPRVIDPASPEMLAEVMRRAAETKRGDAPSLHPLTPEQAILALVAAGPISKSSKHPK